MEHTTHPKYALIIGGSGGLGGQIAVSYAKAGYRAGMTFHQNESRAAKYQATIEEQGGQAETFSLDLRNETSVKALFATLPALDVLVFAAATEIPKSVEHASYEDWREVTSTMIDGAFLCTKYATALLAKSTNPNIIYLPSNDGIHPNGEYLAYQISEASLIAMTKANAKYLGATYGIRVNAVCPGPVRTALWDKAGPNTDELWKSLAKTSPLQRVATPEDIARACLSLTEDPGKFLNGNLLFVDGGSRL